MKTILGAIAGALAVGAVMAAYTLGERHTRGAFDRDAAAPFGYMAGQPAFVPAGQAGLVAPVAPYAPYGPAVVYVSSPAAPAVPAPATQYVSERVVTAQPAVRRVSTARTYRTERVEAPKRSWQKSTLLIGGSAASGAGVGALIGGKKGAGIGALLGGGAAAIYDQAKRH